MTVANNTTRNQYTATSGQTVFPYTFEIFDKDDVVVVQNSTTLSEGTNYTVSGVGNNSGGNITFTSGATAGDTITIYRDMAYERTTDYQTSGDFLAAEVNADFDRLWLAVQQNEEVDTRAVRKPITDADSINMELPAASDRANKVLTFDASGNVNTIATTVGDASSITYKADYTGSVQRLVSTKLDETVSVKDFGAVGDGTADDTAAIQAAVDSGADSIYFPEGTYLVSSTINITAPITLHGRGTIRESSVLFSTIYITADYVNISGMSFVGAETTDMWAGYDFDERNKVSSTLRKSLIRTAGVQGCSFTDLNLSGKRQGFMIDNSLRCHLSDIQFVGILGGVTTYRTATAGQTDFFFDKPVYTTGDVSVLQYPVAGTSENILVYGTDYTFVETLPSSSGVTVRLATPSTAGDRVLIQYDVLFMKPNVITGIQLNAGGQHLLNSIRGSGTGQVLLTGASSSRNVATNVVGFDIHDNGIYNSSGNQNKYIGGVFERSLGSGVKLRGIANLASGFSILDASVGISMTGAVDTPDALGASGFGSIAQSNYIASVRRVGIEINQAYDIYSRDMVIDGNIIEASKMPATGTYSAIRVFGVQDCQVTNNIIRDCPATWAIYFSGWPDGGVYQDHLNGTVSGNIISDATIGMRAIYCDRITISNNTFRDTASDCIELYAVDNSFVTGNNSSKSIELNNSATYQCDNTTVSNNLSSVVYGDLSLCHVQQDPPEYEYQAFTPTLTIAGTPIPSANFNNQHGWSLRIGRMVHVQGRVSCDLSAGLGGLTGEVWLSGLPITSGNTSSGNFSAVALGRVQRWNTNGNPTNAWIDRDSDFIYLSKRNEALFPDDVNAPTVLVTHADLNTSAGFNNEIMFSGTYFVD